MIYVYKASAGSGKTFTLVRQYLKLLLGKKQTRRIPPQRKTRSGTPLDSRHHVYQQGDKRDEKPYHSRT